MAKFMFNIKKIDAGWVEAEVGLGNKKLEFLMSNVLDSGLEALIYLVIGFFPYETFYGDNGPFPIYDRYDCDRAIFNEEPNTVEWKIAEIGTKNKFPILQIDIKAERDEVITLSGKVPYLEFAKAIIGSINRYLLRNGLFGYYKGWYAPFPTTEFLIAKCLLMDENPQSLFGEREILVWNFYIAAIRGDVRKVKLISRNAGTEPPMAEDEYEQILTINDKGTICFTSKNYFGTTLNRSSGGIKRAKAQKLLEQLKSFFVENHTFIKVCDAGTWEITFTTTNGGKYKFNGNLGCEYEDLYDWDDDDEPNALIRFSNEIRQLTKNNKLLAFDGDGGGILLVSVNFPHSWTDYTYLSDDYTLEEGEYVVVPVGKNQKETVAIVSAVDIVKEYKGSTPFESLKKILRRANPEKDHFKFEWFEE